MTQKLCIVQNGPWVMMMMKRSERVCDQMDSADYFWMVIGKGGYPWQPKSGIIMMIHGGVGWKCRRHSANERTIKHHLRTNERIWIIASCRF